MLRTHLTKLKRGGQVLAGILDDFSEVERAMQEMDKAAGSADDEMEIIKDSIDYKLNALKETWVGTAQALVTTDASKGVLDFFTSLSEILNSIANVDFVNIPTIAASIGQALTTYNALKNGQKLEDLGINLFGYELSKENFDNSINGIKEKFKNFFTKTSMETSIKIDVPDRDTINDFLRAIAAYDDNLSPEELKKQAEKSGEQLDIQKVNDLEQMINRFEKKIYDLKTTRIISIQMAPQIRLLQNNDAQLVEKIQSSITNTIPLWKNQIVLALGINNAKSALKDQQEVSKLTNEMLKKNSETLKQGSIEIAQESEKAIIDIETLRKTNQDLIETLDSVIKIHNDGRVKRQEAEKELQSIEQELKNKMLEISVKKNEE